MGDVINFQRVRGEKFELAVSRDRDVDRLWLRPQKEREEGAFLRMWCQEEQAMNDTLRAMFEMERDALREVLADAKPENDDGD